MRTRSQSRHNSPQQEASPVIVEPLRIELPFLEDQFQEDPPTEVSMADNRTMTELLQAPTEGYEDTIVILEITANNFELKHEVAELKDLVRALLLDKKNQSSAPVSSPTHAQLKQLSQIVLPAVGNNFNQNRGGNFNQGGNSNQDQLHRPQVNQPPAYQAPILQTQNVSNTDFESYIKANDEILRNMQSQGQRSGTLLNNTITNPKEGLKGITTRSGVAYQGPTIPTPSKVVKQGTE
nr:hypothetical protein [Tanacetum cinerariifolium]